MLLKNSPFQNEWLGKKVGVSIHKFMVIAITKEAL
jgi:hypothetical protein